MLNPTFHTILNLMLHKIAYARVVLPSGKTLHREVIVFNDNNEVIDHFSLTEELPFVEWKDETFRL